uniref:FAM91 C-terminal domain-containing protein n=1 Tax=Romanomermis culicivorax TaxID=13658 RepID=A0A915K034_ROMCU
MAAILISMAPLSNEITSINCADPPNLGPSVAEVNSSWFRLFLYNLVGNGPVSFLFVKGCRIRKMPQALKGYSLNEEETAIFHVPFPMKVENIAEVAELGHINRHPAVRKLSYLLNLHYTCGYITLIRLNKSIDRSFKNADSLSVSNGENSTNNFANKRDSYAFGYSYNGMLADKDIRKTPSTLGSTESSQLYADWIFYDCIFGLPLFDRFLNKSICDKIGEFDLLNVEKIEAIDTLTEVVKTMGLQMDPHGYKKLHQSKKCKIIFQKVDLTCNCEGKCHGNPLKSSAVWLAIERSPTGFTNHMASYMSSISCFNMGEIRPPNRALILKLEKRSGSHLDPVGSVIRDPDPLTQFFGSGFVSVVVKNVDSAHPY